MKHTYALGYVLAALLLVVPAAFADAGASKNLALLLPAVQKVDSSSDSSAAGSATVEIESGSGNTREVCGGQPKPALECPTGYSVQCNPTGGDHWGCVKSASATVQITNVAPAPRATETTGVEPDEIDYDDSAESEHAIGSANGGIWKTTSAASTGVPELDFLNLPEVQGAIYVVVPSVGGDVTTGGSEGKGKVEHEWKVEEGESTAAHDMFLKIPPIEGDSGDAEASGAVRVAVGDVNGDGSSDAYGKPKEIVVVGSKVRALSEEQIAELKNLAPKTAAEVKTEADLALFAAMHAAEDRPTESVSFNYGKIIVKYQADGKLFWVLPHTFTEEVTLDTDANGKARVKVKLPWYSFLLATDVSASELETDAEAADDGHKEWIEILSIGGGASLEAQAAAHAAAFTSLSNVLKAQYDVVASKK